MHRADGRIRSARAGHRPDAGRDRPGRRGPRSPEALLEGQRPHRGVHEDRRPAERGDRSERGLRPCPSSAGAAHMTTQLSDAELAAQPTAPGPERPTRPSSRPPAPAGRTGLHPDRVPAAAQPVGERPPARREGDGPPGAAAGDGLLPEARGRPEGRGGRPAGARPAHPGRRGAAVDHRGGKEARTGLREHAPADPCPHPPGRGRRRLRHRPEGAPAEDPQHRRPHGLAVRRYTQVSSHIRSRQEVSGIDVPV